MPPPPPQATKRHAPPILSQALQLQVMGTGRTIMVDASPTMTAAQLSRVIAAQTGVPRGSFALYHGSKPMCGTLEESGVTSGSTVELKSRGRGGGPETQASNPTQGSAALEEETRPHNQFVFDTEPKMDSVVAEMEPWPQTRQRKTSKIIFEAFGGTCQVEPDEQGLLPAADAPSASNASRPRSRRPSRTSMAIDGLSASSPTWVSIDTEPQTPGMDASTLTNVDASTPTESINVTITDSHDGAPLSLRQLSEP